MPQKRVYIGVDGTGIAGSERPRRTDTVNAAIRASADWGAAEIIVADSGGLLPELLVPDAVYIEAPLPWGGIDESFSAAILFGSYSNTPGWAKQSIARICIGGVCVEDPCVLTALMAGCRGVPSVAAVGSDFFARAAKSIIPEIEAIALRETLPDGSVRRLHPDKERRFVIEGVGRALENVAGIMPPAIRPPILCDVDFLTAEAAWRASLIPGVRLAKTRSVSFLGEHSEIEPILALILACL